MAIILTRKQSLYLGIGLLGVFFVISAIAVSINANKKVPSSQNILTRESVGANLPQGTQGENTSPLGSAFVLNDFKRNLVRDGKVVWEITGKKGEYSPSSSLAEIQTPQLTLTTKQGDTAVITAGKAVLSMTAADLSNAELFDDVVLRYKDETTLRTSKAVYDKTTEIVTIPVYLEIENPTGFTSADSLSGNVVTREFTLQGNVKTTIKPQKP